MPNNKKVIFGLTGLMASGKGAAAKYLQEHHHAETFRFSTILRALLSRLYIAEERTSLVAMSEAVRNAFGQDILAKAMAGDAKNASAPLLVVEGIRRLADIAYLQELPEFVLVAIDADPKTRYDRLVARAENAGDREKTWEQFLADQERSTEISILPVMERAKEHIENNGTPEDLERQLDALVKKYS
jgi:dephospho-CoA kinase